MMKFDACHLYWLATDLLPKDGYASIACSLSSRTEERSLLACEPPHTRRATSDYGWQTLDLVTMTSGHIVTKPGFTIEELGASVEKLKPHELHRFLRVETGNGTHRLVAKLSESGNSM